MIEIRWIKDGFGHMQLQQRTRDVCVDVSGAFCEFTDWSEWYAVSIVHDPQTFLDVIKLRSQRDIAIRHIAEWCVAIETNGTSWDDWDEYYKDASCRESSLPEIRELLVEAIANVKKEREANGN